MPDSKKKCALIIGASRGLGLGLAHELLGRGWQVTATQRKEAKSVGLEALRGDVMLEMVDINDLAMVTSFVERVGQRAFDVVFINAGIGGPGGTPEGVTPAQTSELFMTNAVSPLRLAYKLTANVRTGTGILAFMSSILGSVSLPPSGFAAMYCASKAALNQLSRGFAADLKTDITVLNMHPGWVRTEMGGENADIDVETSCRGMADVLAAKAGAGGHEFLNYKGETIPW